LARDVMVIAVPLGNNANDLIGNFPETAVARLLF
jgi:hypothetical protein